MAEKKTGIGKLSGATTEAAVTFKADQDSRDSAPRILPLTGNKTEQWRVAKLLKTTLGGDEWSAPRPITKEDLKVLESKIKQLGSRVIKGVTANEILGLSRDADKKRAKTEINHAAPLTIKGGIIHFITNASVQSKDSRHHVMVRLTDYEKAMQLGTPLQAAKYSAQGNLQFDCDCKRHTFWYRYIVTQMGANYGRAELGVPKIRNPNLTGIGCKHTLRVMAELHNSIFIHKRIASAIEQDRIVLADKTRTNRQKVIRLTEKEAKELTKRQDKNKRSVDHAKEKTNAKEKKAAADTLKAVNPPKKDRKPTKKEIDSAIDTFRRMGLSQEQIDAFIAQQRAK